MTTVIVTVFEAAGLTVSGKKKTETMLLAAWGLASWAPPFVIRRSRAVNNLGGVIHEDADLMVEIKRRVRQMWACYKRFGPELYGIATARLGLKVYLLKAEMIETLLSHGCVTWTLKVAYCDELHSTLKSSGESLASSVVRTTPTSRTPRPSRRRSARASNDHPETAALLRWSNCCCFCCCSHIYSHNQVRGHRTGSSHSGGEEYPRDKHKQTKGGTLICHS